jgi:hypothetical protein
MSDDLVKRLREWWEYDHARLIGQSIDRIEELEAKLLTAAEERGILLARIEAQESTNADLLRELQGQKPAQPAPDVAALESDLSFMKACHGELAHQYKELEAKLAKAVEALNSMAILPSHGYIKYFCHKTLAEIEGVTHE